MEEIDERRREQEDVRERGDVSEKQQKRVSDIALFFFCSLGFYSMLSMLSMLSSLKSISAHPKDTPIPPHTSLLG